MHRFTMSKEEIVSCADMAMAQGMGTLMLQSGELPTQVGERRPQLLQALAARRDGLARGESRA